MQIAGACAEEPAEGVPCPHSCGVPLVTVSLIPMVGWPWWPHGHDGPVVRASLVPTGHGVPMAVVSSVPVLGCPHGQGVPCPHQPRCPRGYGVPVVRASLVPTLGPKPWRGGGGATFIPRVPRGHGGHRGHWGCCSGAAGETEAALGPMGTMVGVGGMGGGDSLGSLGMVQGGLGTSGRGEDISGGRRGQQEGGACWGHAGDVTMGWGEGVGCPGDIGDTPGGSKDVEDALGTGCGVWDGVAGATVGRVEGGPWGLGTVLGGWGSRGRVGDAGRGQMETLSVTQAGSR